ncbi:uncharacterized protein RAG0_14714 [Rhynchosporium agropyri]|uniref:Uncharacterized protein n=1 Tax=Rhynchosporium agropyri TaxID=914238 RepID=A0A1E1LI37_9HELO|nr:uncharacterized protein RAG0_14714 [Rhynchosporium agropyri]
MSKSDQYSVIEDASNFIVGPASQEKKHSKSGKIWQGTSFVLAFSLSLLILMLVTSTAILLRPQDPKIDAKDAFTADFSLFPNCGSSVAEAKSGGCEFDPMVNGWTPQECFNRELSEEFMALPNYTWYYDADHAKPIPADDLYSGELAITYPEPFHHDRHCLYTWRKLHLATMLGTMVDSDTFWYNHSAHCTSYLLRLIPLQKAAESHRAFLTCLPLGLNQVQ